MQSYQNNMNMILVILTFLILTSYTIEFNPLHHLRHNSLSKYSSSGAIHYHSNKQFSDYEQIPIWLINTLNKLGFDQPTLAQEKSLPSHTGSGKTLAYSLPIISNIDPSRAAIQAVVVVPTRELGLQVSTVLKQLSSGSPEKIMIMSVMEGSRNRRQILWATAEPPHIVVGNPRALQRLVDMGRLRLNAVTYIVLDEVDACLIESTTRQELHRLLSRDLSASFQSNSDTSETGELIATDGRTSNYHMKENRVYKDLARDHLPGEIDKYRLQRQTIMCSATIPQRQHFAANCFQKGWTETLPELVNTSEGGELVPIQVQHQHIPCAAELRLACLLYILKLEIKQHIKHQQHNQNISSDNKGSIFQAIIFVDSKQIDYIQEYKEAIQTMINELTLQYDNHNRNTNSQTNNNSNSNNKNNKEQKIEDNLMIPSNPIPSQESNIHQFLGLEVVTLVDTMELDQRGKGLNSFRDGDASVLICSDIAARGLDIPNTSLVIQMSLPGRMEDYLHRAGRTGRLNRNGTVITFTNDEEDFVIERYSNELGVTIQKRVLKAKAN